MQLNISFIFIQNFFTSMAIFALGIFVLSKKPKDQTNVVFFLFALCVFWWQFWYAISYLVDNEKFSAIFLRTGYIGVIFLAITAYHLTLVLTKNINKFMTFVTYLVGVFFIFLLVFTNKFMSGTYYAFWGYYPVAGEYHIFYMLFWTLLTPHLLWILFRSYRKFQGNKDQANKVKYVFFGLFIFAIGVIDFIPNYRIGIYPLGSFFTLAYAIIITYAIVRHKLLDIEVVVNKTIVYSILIAIITTSYFLSIYFLERILNIIIGYKSILLTTSFIAFFSVVFIPIKSKIQQFVDRRFFRGSIDQINEENVKLREELQKSEKMKSIATLAAGMAHEIKNPLTAIKTFTEYLPEKYNNPEFVDKFHKIVGGEVERINNIVKQLLEFSRPSDPVLKDTDINALLDETLSFLNNDLVRYGIKAEKKYGAIPSIKIDPYQTKQVFLNLFLNAIDAMPSGGVLTIATSLAASRLPLAASKAKAGDEQLATSDERLATVPSDERPATSGSSPSHEPLVTSHERKVTIRIRDTGTGISKDDLKHIFDPFFTKKDGGTGLRAWDNREASRRDKCQK